MTKRILAILVVLLLPSAALADDASHRQACEELMNVFQVEKMLGPLKNQMKMMQKEILAKMKVPEEVKDLSSKYADRINDLVMKELSWENLKNDYVGIYMEVFSEQETRELLNFYRSPIGEKFIEKSPELMQKSFAVSTRKTQKLLPEMQRLAKELENEIAERKRTGK